MMGNYAMKSKTAKKSIKKKTPSTGVASSRPTKTSSTAKKAQKPKAPVAVKKRIARKPSPSKQPATTLKKITPSKYQKIIEQIEDGYFEVDLAGNFTFFNDSVSRVLGYSKKELLGMNYRQYTEKDSVPEVFATYHNIYKTGLPNRYFSSSVITKTGCKKYLEGSISLLRNTKGKAIGFGGILRDVSNRKQAEDTCKEAEHKFRTIFDHASDGIMLARVRDRKLIEANEKSCQMLGYSREELLTLNISDIHPKEYLPNVIEQFIRLTKKEISVVYDLPAIKKDKTLFFVDVTGSTVNYDGTECLLGIFRDVTERKKAEEELIKSSLLNEAIVDSIPGILYLYDENDRLIRWNILHEHLTGYSSEELKGRYILDWFGGIEPDTSVIRNAIDEAMKTGRASAEAHLIAKDGHRIPMFFTGVRLSMEGKAHILGVGIDITERKRAEEELKISEQKFKSIVSTSSEWIWMLDTKGQHTFSNSASERILGYTPDEILSSGTADHLIFEDDIALLKETFASAIKEKQGWSNVILQWKHKNGTIRYLESNAVPVFDQEGNVAGFQGSDRDITERRLAEQALRKNERMFKNLFENSPVGKFILKDRLFVDVNPALVEIGGYPREEVIGQSVSLFYRDQEENERVGKFIYDEIEKKGVGISDVRLRRKNGEEFDGLLYLSKIDPEDSSMGYQGTLLDFTERKQAEEALRASEEKFALAFQNSPNAMSLSRFRDGRYEDVNDAYASALGYERDELIGRTSSDINLWVDTADRNAIVRKIMETGKVADQEIRYRHRNGDIRWGLTSASIIKIGNESFLLTQSQDITEKKLIEKALREKEEIFHGITHNLPGIIFQFYAKDTGEYGVSYLSEPMNEFEEIMSKAETENVDAIFPEFFSRIHKEDQERFLESIKSVTETMNRWNFEGRVFTRLGKMIWFQGLSIPTRLEDRVIFDGIILNISERKTAEEAALKEYSFSNTLLDTLPAPFYMFDYEKAHFYRWNKDFSDVSGYSDEELPHMTPFDLVPKSEHDILMSAMEKVLSEGKVTSEMTIVSKDGSTTPYLLSGNTLNYEGKSYVIGMGINIAERKRAEEALRIEEQRFRILTDQSSDIILLINADGKILYENPAVERVMGYRPEERIGHNVLENAHPDDLNSVLTSFNELIKAKEPLFKQGETRIRNADGSWHTFEVAASNLLQKNKDKAEAIIINLRDITERKQAEEKMRSQEQKFRTLAEQSSDIILLLDKNGTILYENPAIETLLGYKPEERIGLNTFNAIHPDDLDKIRHTFNTLVGDKNAPPQHAELRVQHRNGSWREFEIVARNIINNSLVEAVIVNLRDITERKKSEEEIRKMATVVKFSSELVNLALPSRQMIFLNEAGSKILGIDPDHAGEHNVMEVIPEHFRDLVEREIFTAIEAGNTWEGNLQYRNIQTGKLTDAHAITFPIKDAITGKLLYVANVSRDITEYKRAEGYLRESEEKFRILTECTPTAVMLYQNDKWVYANPAASEISGYSNEELLSMNFWDFVHPDDRHITLERGKKRQIGEPVTSRYTLRIIAKDGSVKWLDLSGATISLSGSPAGIVSVLDITENKMADEALRERDDRFKKLSAHVPGLIYQFLGRRDGTYSFPFATESIRTMFGCSPDDVRDDMGPVTKVIYKDDLERLFQSFKDSWQKRGMWELEFRVELPGQPVKWYFGHATPEKLPNGDILSHGYISDITERKAAEERIKISEANLTDAQTQAHMGSWEFDALNQKIFWSDEMYRIINRDPTLGPMSFNEFIDLVHPYERKAVKKDIIKCFNSKIPFHHEYRMVLSDNRLIFIEGRGKTDTDPQGNPMRISGIIQDVSERKRTEEMLILIKNAVEGSSDAIGIADPQGRHYYQNKAFTDLLGYTLEEVVERGAQNLIYADPDVARDVFHTIMNGGSWSGEVEDITKDGRRLTVLLRADAIRDEQGKIIGLIGVNTDITLSKRTEAELSKYREHLEELVHERTSELEVANKELESFSYSASHDLRAPIRTIDGFSEALMEDCYDQLDDQGKDYLSRIRTSTRNMMTLIDDMLKLSRITRTEMTIEDIDLSRIAHSIISELKASQPERQVNIKIAEGLTDRADERLMHIALNNLLGNAWKFTQKKENASIEFGTMMKDNKKVYFVRDNGAGFDMAYINKVFAPFQRLHTVEEFPGSGIGLATVRRIINRHGGDAWAEGEVNQGATIYFRLS